WGPGSPLPSSPLVASIVRPVLLGGLHVSFATTLTQLRFELIKAELQLRELAGHEPEPLVILRRFLPHFASGLAGNEVRQIQLAQLRFELLCERAERLGCELPPDLHPGNSSFSLRDTEALCKAAVGLNWAISKKRGVYDV